MEFVDLEMVNLLDVKQEIVCLGLVSLCVCLGELLEESGVFAPTLWWARFAIVNR